MLTRSLSRRCGALPVLLLVAAVAGCSDDPLLPDVDENERGALLDIQRVERLSESEIRAFGLPITVGSAVELERITYRTIDARGALTQAGALVVVPTRTHGPLPLVSYQHGTRVRKDDVASLQGTADAEALVAVAFGTDGYLAVMPDYLGLGVSPGLHPYVHASSLATSVVDALRAARHYAAWEEIELDDRVFLLGYSEGGYATAAAQQVIEAAHRDEFLLTASAPMATPWDLSGTMFELFSSPNPYRAPYFLPYLLLAYNDIYAITHDLRSVFVTPFDETLPPLFDGSRSGGEIDRALPDVPRDILAPAFIDGFLSPEAFPWRLTLEDNDLLDWSPTTRTRTFHCISDDLVPVSNAELAVASFRQRGVPEAVVDLVTGDFGNHEECAPVFLLLAKFWMDEIRAGKAPADRPTLERLRSLDWRPVRP